MKKVPLWCAISYSIVSIWWTFRFLTNLPQIAEQANWITVGDVLALSGFWLLAISYWIIFLRSRKQDQGKDGEEKKERE